MIVEPSVCEGGALGPDIPAALTAISPTIARENREGRYTFHASRFP
jgi:hypothetical protein